MSRKKLTGPESIHFYGKEMWNDDFYSRRKTSAEKKEEFVEITRGWVQKKKKKETQAIS